MKPSTSLCQLTAVFLSLSPLASAWPTWLPALDSLVVRRQDSDDSSSTTSTTTKAQPTETASPTSGGATITVTTTTGSTSGKSQPQTTNLNTGGKTVSGSKTGTTGNATHTTYNEQDPAGNVVMITPAATSGLQLYKVGDYVTWAWNYTNLQGTPTAVDVYVSCSTATETWTLTQNMTYETTGAYTWDTGDYQATAAASPLLTEEYTLIIVDADSSISATAQAGYLAPFDQFVFGMYTKRPYKDYDDGFVCATCSAGVSDTERRAIGFAALMATITVASFTWFVTGLW